ncbi:MAG: hypothetical protein Q8O71_03890 [bacterium]|nr:hypothetical protein [bacterium]
MQHIALLSQELAKKLNIPEELIKRYLISRLDRIIKYAKFFILEDEYIEREWKEMVSLHYINTTYQFKPFVARIHFFKDKVIESDFYLGFANIRPIGEVSASLSFIYPNWKMLAHEFRRTYGEDVYVMTYKKTVHICGKELIIHTFPFFSQDGVVTICAHAAIAMVTKFVRRTLEYNLIKLSDIVGGYSFKTKMISSEGITIYHMIEIFNNAKIPISSIHFNKYKEYFREWADSYIESKLPIILTSNDHVITVIGHTLGIDNRRKYLVYDDSGAFFQQKDLDGDTRKGKSFVDLVNWEAIEDYIKPNGYMIVPEMEKVFIPFPNMKKNYVRFVKSVFLKEGYEVKSERFLIVDNSILKNFLMNPKKKTLSDKDKSRFEEMVKSNLPHYLWFCEVVLSKNGREMMVGIIADPTRHLQSSSSMFYNFRIRLDRSISLLTI